MAGPNKNGLGCCAQVVLSDGPASWIHWRHDDDRAAAQKWGGGGGGGAYFVVFSLTGPTLYLGV